MGTAISMWRYGTLVAILWTCLAASSVSCDGGGRDAHTVKQVLGQEYANAKCLDGTPGAYYANVNTKANGTWVIYLNGGGECVDENQCAARAKTKLGSSKLMDDELWMNYGVLDTNESTNPQFYEANFVRIGYCSGDLYLGSRQEPDDSGLLFQGRFIVHGVLDDLQNKYGFLDTADTIVFGGESAGGIGSLALMDEVASSLKLMGSKARFFGSIQGGYYFLNDRVYQGTHPKPGNYIPWGTDVRMKLTRQGDLDLTSPRLHPPSPSSKRPSRNTWSTGALRTAYPRPAWMPTPRSRGGASWRTSASLTSRPRSSWRRPSRTRPCCHCTQGCPGRRH